jgi:hypothetical protein
MTKTIQLNWQQWVAYCAEHYIDPRKQLEDSHDLGGGNSLTIECFDDPPEINFKVFRPPGRDKSLDAKFVEVLEEAERLGVGNKELIDGILNEYKKPEEEKNE